MTLIASISGIRGTIGGGSGSNLTPLDIVKFTSAFGVWLSTKRESRKIVLGRDARPSGEMLDQLVSATLVGLGFEVINLGLSTTPTVEMAVPYFEAAGGIILTASHNPGNWNALKLLNYKGEFVSKKDGSEILDLLENEYFNYATVDHLGSITHNDTFYTHHEDQIMAIPLVDSFAIKKKKFRVAVDAVNSSGGIFIPRLLKKLGVDTVYEINCVPDGNFAHNPEPLRKNLDQICEFVRDNEVDLGIVVDPDVDRLVFVDEKGELFGEEYTLVAIADYVLQIKKGAVVSNLSSSRALRDVADKYGCPYRTSAVGEVNVIEKMKRHDAVIGGEGNGGIIYPELHYGRDALVGTALFLTYLAKFGGTCSELRATYPDYFMSKDKVELEPEVDVDALLKKLEESEMKVGKVNTIDGLKVDFKDSWVHIRKSNTEPIVRIYTEAKSQDEASKIATTYKEKLLSFVK